MVAYIPPAIDPLSTKTTELPYDLCRRVIADSGLNLLEPILLQVARFDLWKDPFGVIEAYRLVKKERSSVQLALVGAMAGDDPEGWEILDGSTLVPRKIRTYMFLRTCQELGIWKSTLFSVARSSLSKNLCGKALGRLFLKRSGNRSRS